MELEPVVAWIDHYVDAWRSNDAIRIGALFTEDATYAYHPWDDPLRGRDAIVEDWLKEPDEPGSWEAHYRPLSVEGDRAIVTGETRYVDGETYSNLFVVDFDGNGRCRHVESPCVTKPETLSAGASA